MLPIRLRVLGTAAARPWPGAQPSSALVTRGGTAVLIDCGEGTLVRLPPKMLSERGLGAVCISHLHGDHVYGLPGLLTSMTLAGRTRALTLLGPARLREYLEGVFAVSEARLGFELRYPILPPTATAEPLWRGRDLEVRTLPLRHRIVTHGFCVSTPVTGRKLRAGVVEQYGIPYDVIPALRSGEDFRSSDGTRISNSELTLEPAPQRSIAYVTDTAPLDLWPETLPQPTVMLHDATFAPGEEELARKTGHSTSTQAAAFAKTARAETLLLTHASVRYSPAQREAMATAAAEYFAAVRWAREGEVLEIG